MRVKDFDECEHWTGNLWQNDGFVIDVLLHFGSATQAADHMAVWKSQSPNVALSPEPVGQTVTLQGLMDGDLRVAIFVVGDNFYEVTEASVTSSLPTVVQFQTVVAAALERATASS